MSQAIFVGGFAVGVLLLALGLFVAPMVTASNASATTTISVGTGNTADVQQNLEVEVNSVNSTSNDANLTARDTRTFNQNTTTLGEGNTTSLQVSGETVTIEYVDLRTDPIFDVTYPPTFSYDDNVVVFYDNLGLLLSLIGFSIAGTFLFVGVKAA